jgi:predicted amidohydrolase YtcJ
MAMVESLATSVPEPADLIFTNARVVTVDQRFSIVQAVGIRGDRIVVLGDDRDVLRLRGPKTRVIDADGRTVLPGLYDSHVHPVGAATSELTEPLTGLASLQDVFAYLGKKASTTPEGQWIVLRFAFPTRLKEARFPTRLELDRAAPRHPVLYHAGPAGVANSMALKVSGVTRDTPNPRGGVIVKDPVTGEPTGMLRNAFGVLKGVPSGSRATQAAQRAAVLKLFHLYNAQGITSIADRDAGRTTLDLYLSLKESKELTIRINVARSFNPSGTREQVARHLQDLEGQDHLGGPTGVGDIWVRIGPIKFYLDGGILSGTAFMRRPWPKGVTYQIVEDDYRGLLFVDPEQVKVVVEEAARRNWRVTAHTAGEAAMDVLLDAYEFVNRQAPIKDRRFCITHANFQSERNLARCRELGVCADVQPAWLFKDGAALASVLDPQRMRWFQPYKTWLKHTTIGGGSDHMIGLDSLKAINPWNPWLGIQTAVTRVTEDGTVLNPEERLSREEAIRLYTLNNAYLNQEEKEKGRLEVGKLADLIILDRDLLTCPANTIRNTQVLYTVVGGRIVYQSKK